MNIVNRLALRIAGNNINKAINDLLKLRVKAIGDVTPYGLAGRPQAPRRDLGAAFDAALTNEVVFACLDAMCTAAVDPRLYVERGAKGNWEEQEGHPATRLLMRPHPLYSELQFRRAALTMRHVAGVFYVEKIRATKNGPPVALWPIDPSRLKPVPDGAGGIAEYEYGTGSDKRRIPNEDVLAWTNPDPRDRYQNVSPLSVALGSVGADTIQTNYTRAFFEAGGTPAGILTVKDRVLEDGEADMIRQKWRANFDPRHGGSRADVAVLDVNAQYQETGSKLDEIENEALRSIAESRICMVFGVPPLVIYSYFGLVNSKYSNLKQAWDQFWASKLTPWFKEYRTWLTHALLPEFESEDLILGERVRFQWDMSQVAAMADDMDAIAARANSLYEGNLATRNEARQMAKLPDVPAGNVFADGSKPEAEQPGAAADIQTLALNGAQIGSLVQVVQAVTDGRLAPGAALKIIQYSFPTISKEDAEAMIAEAQRLEPATETTPALLPAPSEDDTTKRARKAAGPDAVKAIDDSKEALVRRFTPKFESYIIDEYNAAADAVAAGGDVGGDDGTRAKAIGRPLYRAAISAAYDDANELLAEQNVDLAFNLKNPRVVETIAGLLTKITRVSDTTKEDIRAEIAKGLDEGLSIEDIARRVREKAPEIGRSRAETIARTETADAYTRGALLAYEESGVVTHVEWNSTLDNRTSDVCTGLNGKRVELGKAFEGGFGGPPAHPNCRSAILPIVE